MCLILQATDTSVHAKRVQKRAEMKLSASTYISLQDKLDNLRTRNMVPGQRTSITTRTSKYVAGSGGCWALRWATKFANNG